MNEKVSGSLLVPGIPAAGHNIRPKGKECGQVLMSNLTGSKPSLSTGRLPLLCEWAKATLSSLAKTWKLRLLRRSYAGSKHPWAVLTANYLSLVTPHTVGDQLSQGFMLSLPR